MRKAKDDLQIFVPNGNNRISNFRIGSYSILKALLARLPGNNFSEQIDPPYGTRGVVVARRPFQRDVAEGPHGERFAVSNADKRSHRDIEIAVRRRAGKLRGHL